MELWSGEVNTTQDRWAASKRPAKLIRAKTIHAHDLWNDLRPADRKEAEAGGLTLDMLKEVVQHTHVVAIVNYNGIAVSLMGTGGVGETDKKTSIWMLAANGLIKDYAAPFIRYSLKGWKIFERPDTHYVAYSHKDNTTHHRWLEHVGFSRVEGSWTPGPQFIEYERKVL